MESLPILSDKIALDNLDGDKELLNEIRITFSETAPQILDQLTEDALLSKPEELLRTIHSLKSSAGSIGAEKLSSLARNAEWQFRNESPSSVIPLLSDLVACLKLTIQELQGC